MFLIQQIYVRRCKPPLRFGRLTVGPQLVGVIDALRNASACFSGQLQLVDALQARVVPLRLLQFPMRSAGKGEAGDLPDGMA